MQSVVARLATSLATVEAKETAHIDSRMLQFAQLQQQLVEVRANHSLFFDTSQPITLHVSLPLSDVETLYETYDEIRRGSKCTEDSHFKRI